MRTSIGLIVNPIAGMGGAVALKGTDGAETAREALRRGAAPVAPARVRRFLARLAARRDLVELWAAAGAMGERVAAEAGWPTAVAGPPATVETTAADTVRAARAMRERGVRLIVLAGGDGTARDVLAAVGEAVPILGIPAGVKMHSAVFASSPEAAAGVVERFLEGGRGIELREAEVMDIDEAELRRGRLSARLYGYARVPFERRHMQGPKAGGASEDARLEGAAAEIVAGMQPGTVHLVGPGTTMRLVKRRLGTEGTLLGVDAFLDGRVLGLDLTASQVLAAVEGRPARIVLGVTGGQGFLFGRGNQQLSPAVIRRVGKEGITVVASASKLLALEGRQLSVDTGDPDLDRTLAGFVRVMTGPGEAMLMRIAEPT